MAMTGEKQKDLEKRIKKLEEDLAIMAETVIHLSRAVQRIMGVKE